MLGYQEGRARARAARTGARRSPRATTCCCPTGWRCRSSARNEPRRRGRHHPQPDARRARLAQRGGPRREPALRRLLQPLVPRSRCSGATTRPTWSPTTSRRVTCRPRGSPSFSPGTSRPIAAPLRLPGHQLLLARGPPEQQGARGGERASAGARRARARVDRHGLGGPRRWPAAAPAADPPRLPAAQALRDGERRELRDAAGCGGAREG